MMEIKRTQQTSARRITIRAAAVAFAFALIGGTGDSANPWIPSTPSRAEAAPDSDEVARIRHLLQRATFGYTGEEAARVREMGRNAWVAEQLSLQPADDPELAERLAIYPSLTMEPAELLQNYPTQNRDNPVGLGPPQRILTELRAAQITRAVHARAQLREVLTDFWFNHFNVFANAGPTRYTIVPYLRDAIRPHVLGRFEDLLRATAESPAMLYYLDNASSTAPGARGRNSGINENYARELLELHTLGVDGGYTQKDIEEVARAFTGWTFTPRRTGAYEFQFVPRLHDPGDKQVLGTTIASGDRSEGDTILTLLARHPQTARFLSRKLVTRLVSDDPPEALVEWAATIYQATDGNLAFVTAVILGDAEFYSPEHRGTKVKTPLEMVASSLRTVGADVRVGTPLFRAVGDLGQPLLESSPPTGWPEKAEDFLSPGGMVSRFELAYAIASNQIPNIDWLPLSWDLIVGLFGTDGLAVYVTGQWPDADTSAALRRARENGASPTLLAALALSSPAFQLQ